MAPKTPSLRMRKSCAAFLSLLLLQSQEGAGQGDLGKKSTGFTDVMKDAFCDAVNIKMFCGGSGSASAAAACTTQACCAGSTCYSDSLPMMKCDSGRGPTKCIGGSMLSMKAGICQCKYGPCSAGTSLQEGKCPTQTSSLNMQGLFEEREVVAENQDASLVDDASLAILAVGLVMSGMVLGMRRRGRPMQEDQDLLPAGDNMVSSSVPPPME